MIRRALPSLAILLAIAGITLGGYLAAGALATPMGPPVVVGGIVAVQPLSGWEQVDFAGATDQVPTVRLTRGTASLDVFAPVQAQDPADLLRRYVRLELERNATELEVSEDVQTLQLPLGSAVRATYAGRFPGVPTRIEGEVTAVVDPAGLGIVFDAWGPQNVFGYSVDDTEHMIERAHVV